MQVTTSLGAVEVTFAGIFDARGSRLLAFWGADAKWKHADLMATGGAVRVRGILGWKDGTWTQVFS